MEEEIGWLGGEDVFADDDECDVGDTDVLFSGVSVDHKKSYACYFGLLFGHRRILLRTYSHRLFD